MRSSGFAALLVALLPGTAGATTLALLQSKSLAPYERAAESFVSSVGEDVRRYNLAEQPENVIVHHIQRLRPPLLIAVGTEALRVAAERLPELPTVFLMVLGAEPRDRTSPFSGVTLEIPAAEQIRALQRLRPDLKRIGLLYDPAESAAAVARLREAARRAELSVDARAVSNTREAMAAMPELFADCDAYIVVPDRTTAGNACFELSILLSVRYRVPVFAPSRKYVEKGALAALGATFEDVGEQAAGIARLILAGEPTPEPESPRVFALIVNEKIADKLGVDVPSRYQGRVVEVVP